MDGQFIPGNPIQFEGRGPRNPWHKRDMKEIITGLGLSSNLKLCLDAGDSASYTSGQSWLDRSGGGYDFFRGADGSATATDPTFNGSAGGLSASEYWSFDGGDYFTYDTTNETWMENLHKSGAQFTVLMWVYPTATDNRFLYATCRATTAEIGILIRLNNRLELRVFNGIGGTVRSADSTAGLVVTNTWQLIGVSLDSGDASTGCKLFSNGTTETFSGAYGSPSASSASYTTKIGANGAGTGAWMANDSRLAVVACWDGVALTQAQMGNVFTATRGRFGV